MVEEERAPTVLVVDDEPVIVRLLHRMLDDEFVVRDAHDGASAIAAWRSAPVDVIVLDQMMPGMSGLDVAARVLADDPHQRIVLFTAVADRDLAAKATVVGVKAFVKKTDVAQIADVLSDVLADA
jgi:CheY-like chemotaxis protein